MTTEDDFGPVDYTELDAGPSRSPLSRGRSVVDISEARWRHSMTHDQKGRPLNTVGNAVLILGNHEAWKGLGYDKFRDEASLINPPHLDGWAPPKKRLDDYAVTFICQWLHRREGVKLGVDVVGRAAEVASKMPGRARHPVREYLDGLEWDGVRRLDTFLSAYMSAKQTSYTATIWRYWMTAAVARVMRPGCKADTMVILEGDQGSGKSSAIESLLPYKEWFSDTELPIGKKDGWEGLRGKLIYELGELESMRKTEVTRMKSFLSSSVDNYRKSYGRGNEDHPRQCVFIGTTNEDCYLKDSTGNRRFWPVRVGRIDQEGIEKVRDQLWAEAYSYYIDGHEWHIKDPDLAKEAAREQEKREAVDPWEDMIREWIESPMNLSSVEKGVTTVQIMEEVLKLPAHQMHDGSSGKVGKALARLGFEKHDGYRPRRYYKKEE